MSAVNRSRLVKPCCVDNFSQQGFFVYSFHQSLRYLNLIGSDDPPLFGGWLTLSVSVVEIIFPCGSFVTEMDF